MSCRRVQDGFCIVTDRWQKVTEEKITVQLLDTLFSYCGEFLVHAVDMEGRAGGIEEDLVKLLGNWGKCPVTYAGGVHTYEDLEILRKLGRNRLNVTIGSMLDLFGGNLSWKKILEITNGSSKEE